MKKDQADEFEQELLQPLAKALRTTLGDTGQVHVNNEPHLMTGNRVEYETWLEVALNDARTEVIFRPLSLKTSLRSGNGERAADSSSRFHKRAAVPATALEHPLTLSPNASAKQQVCGMRSRPSGLAGQSPEGNLAAER